MAISVRLFLGFILPVFIVLSVYIGFILYIKGIDFNDPNLITRWKDGFITIFLAGYVYEGVQSLAYTILMELWVRKKHFPENKKLYVIDSGILGAIAGFLILIPSIIINLVFNHGLPPIFVHVLTAAVMAIVGAISGVISGFVLWWVTKKLPD